MSTEKQVDEGLGMDVLAARLYVVLLIAPGKCVAEGGNGQFVGEGRAMDQGILGARFLYRRGPAPREAS